MKSSSLPELPHVELGSQERRSQDRSDLAARTERGLAQHITVDFDSASPSSPAAGPVARVVFVEVVLSSVIPHE